MPIIQEVALAGWALFCIVFGYQFNRTPILFFFLLFALCMMALVYHAINGLPTFYVASEALGLAMTTIIWSSVGTIIYFVVWLKQFLAQRYSNKETAQ